VRGVIASARSVLARARTRRTAILGVALTGLLASSVGMAGSAPGAEPDAPLRMLSGWVAYWNGDRGPQGIVAMGPLSNAISPFAYDVRGADRVERRGTAEINARMRQASVAARLPLITTVFDSTDDGLMASILKD
ncbi:hypothetical protein RM554_31765, partial [Streptomyces sp. DSM 41859]|nr:hypothetical protein [Streptomyces sp. DSM 41859]